MKYELKTNDGRTLPVEVGTPAGINSFFVFSLHKAGSTLMYQLLEQVCAYAKVPQFEPEMVEYENGLQLGKLDASIQQCFERRGFCYSGFRFFPDYLRGFDLAEFKKVLLIRDPRDMLVSHYFSQKFSHEIPQGKLGDQLQQMRNSLETTPIEEYVLQWAVVLKRKYEAYQAAVFDDNLKLFRYEDVIFNKEAWLTELLDYVELVVPPELISGLAQQFDARPGKEDPGQHIRKVTPGDHREKLSAETIVQLDEIFSPILAEFGYEKLNTDLAPLQQAS